MNGELPTNAGLPLPRLELRWVKTGETWYVRECIYELVMPLRNWDVRRECGAKQPKFDCLRIEMGRTYVDGGNGKSPVCDGVVDAPFRDGAHARWDGEVLGLQVWATCGECRTKLWPKMA